MAISANVELKSPRSLFNSEMIESISLRSVLVNILWSRITNVSDSCKEDRINRTTREGGGSGSIAG